MTIALNVPFSQKDIAKRLGAKWDPSGKVWTIPDDSDLTLFQLWLPANKLQNRQAVELDAVADPLSVTNKPNFVSPALPNLPNGADELVKPTQQVADTSISLSKFMSAVGAVIKRTFNEPRWVHVELSKMNERGQHTYFDFVEYDDNGREVAKARGMLWANKRQSVLGHFVNVTQ